VSPFLAIDTATDRGSVAIGQPGDVLHEIAIPNRMHAVRTMPAMADLLQRTGIQWSDLSGLLVADGPGSFTGLRIGLATAKGIVAVHSHLQLLATPSLLGTAWAARKAGGGTVATLYDALRGDVFVAVYHFALRAVEVVIEPRLTSVRDLGTLPVPDVVAGDGVAAHADAVSAWIGSAATVRCDTGASAGALIELLAVRGGVRTVEDVGAFEPAYGRRAAAQDRWEATHGRPLPDPAGD
jgi:tRNA threonylcarbamoyl adenosine modification protein YeaZ